MRKIHRIALLLLTLLMIVSLGLSAFAAGPVDLLREGSITVTLKLPKDLSSYGTLTLYRVADIYYDHVDDAAVPGDERGYRFDAVAAIDKGTLNLDDLDEKDLAEDVADLVADAEKAGTLSAYATAAIRYSAASQRAEAAFDPLLPGLYLAVQKTPAKGYYALSPFLISLPYNVKGQYVYDITAEAKPELEKEVVTETTAPGIPQTGQLNWPVPTLAAGGMLLMAIGWTLRCRKREENA